VSAPDLVTLIDDCDRRWNPEVILFESNAAFLGIKDLLVRHARFGPRVKGVCQSSDKGARVASFSVSVENGSFRLKGDGADVDAGQRGLFEEMTAFPHGDRDDLLDAAATGCAYLLHRREPRFWDFGSTEFDGFGSRDSRKLTPDHFLVSHFFTPIAVRPWADMNLRKAEKNAGTDLPGWSS
jgi:hypothetical protein